MRSRFCSVESPPTAACFALGSDLHSVRSISVRSLQLRPDGWIQRPPSPLQDGLANVVAVCRPLALRACDGLMTLPRSSKRRPDSKTGSVDPGDRAPPWRFSVSRACTRSHSPVARCPDAGRHRTRRDGRYGRHRSYCAAGSTERPGCSPARPWSCHCWTSRPC